MAIVRDVQSTGSGVDGSTLTQAFTVNPATGDWIVVFAGSFDSSGTPAVHNAPTDSLGTTYTQIGSTQNDATKRGLSMWYGKAPSSGANTVTANWASNANTRNIAIWLITSTASDPYNGDVVATVLSPNGSTSTLSAGTTSCGGLNAIHLGAIVTGAGNPTVGSGFNTNGDNGFDSGTMFPNSGLGDAMSSEFKVSTSNQTVQWSDGALPLYLAIAASFSVAPPPVVSSVSASTGTTLGGDNVTITGLNFVASATAKFDTTSATGVTVVNDTTITCTTPAHSAALVNVSVTNPDSQTGTGTNKYTFSGPVVTSIVPADGAYNGADAIVINGLYFGAGATVSFDSGLGAASGTSVTVVSSIKITCTSPAYPSTVAHYNATSGIVSVVVTNTDAQTGNGAFTYHAPTLSGITGLTTGRSTGGTNTTLTGSYLTGATSVKLISPAGTIVTCTNFVLVNTTTITCTIPAAPDNPIGYSESDIGGVTAQVGVYADVYVVVAGYGNTNIVLDDWFWSPPLITAVSPTYITMGGGTAITITGTCFPAAVVVTIDGNRCTNVVVNAFNGGLGSTSITCVAPAHVQSIHENIRVTADYIDNTMYGEYSYLIYTPPVINSCTPSKGPTVGGTAVTLVGSYFTGTSFATFDGLLATSFVVVSDTIITCTTPAHSYGPVDVSVWVLGYPGTLPNGYFYMAAGWWYSTNDFDGDVTAVDPSASGRPTYVRDWTELAFATGNASYMGGSPGAVCAFNNKLIYAKGNYTVGTTLPSIRWFDGAFDRELCKAPKTSAAVVPKAILALLTANGVVYFSTWDSGTTSTNYAGRVFSLDVKSGAVVQVGDDVFTGGHLPYALGWYQGKLWVGTNLVDVTKDGKIYFIRPGITTAWTTDKTFTAASIGCLLGHRDDLYAGLITASTVSSTLQKRPSGGTGADWATSDTNPAASPANFNGYVSLAEYGGNLYAGAYNPGVRSIIRKLVSGSWSSAYSVASATVVPYIGLIPDQSVLIAAGGRTGGGDYNSLLSTPDGSAFTDLTAFLDGSTQPIGPGFSIITVS